MALVSKKSFGGLGLWFFKALTVLYLKQPIDEGLMKGCGEKTSVDAEAVCLRACLFLFSAVTDVLSLPLRITLFAKNRSHEQPRHLQTV